MAETVALTLEQIAAQKEAADRDRQRQLEWAVVIQRQLDSGCADDATLVPREGDRERQVERVMTSYGDGSFLIDRLAAGMVVDQDCAKSCQTGGCRCGDRRDGNGIGIVEVALFAASAEFGAMATITSTLRPTRSAANAGS